MTPAERLERFTALTKRFSPARSPKAELDEGFYVARPRSSLAEKLRTLAEINPTCAQLVLGGVGTGKTTELLVAREMLDRAFSGRAWFVDVPSEHDPLVGRGVLLAAAAKAIATDAAESSARTRVLGLAHGFWDDGYGADPDPGLAWRQGVLKPAAPRETELEIQTLLTEIVGGERAVVLLDGTDRFEPRDAATANQLAAILSDDVQALTAAGVGSVVVGPLALRGNESLRGIERIHHHSAIPVDDEGLAYLLAVLDTREPDHEILPEQSRKELAKWSGGVLVDLVKLTRMASLEAYAEPADSVEPQHVRRAAGLFGQELVQQKLDAEMASRLAEIVAATRYGRRIEYTLASEVDVRLQRRRVLIEVSAAKPYFIPHPTIVSFFGGTK